MFCPKCGTQNADGARFCLKCGASLAPDAVKTEPAVPDEKPLSAAAAEESKWPKIFWIIAAVGVVIGLLSSLILLIGRIATAGFLSGLSAAFSANRIFTGLFLIAAAVVFFIPVTKKYPYVVAIPRAVLGLIAFIDSIVELVKAIKAGAGALLIISDVLWFLAGTLFFLAGVACLLAIIFRDKLKGKEKIAVLVLGGAAILIILLGLLASLLQLIFGITLIKYNFGLFMIHLAYVLFHAALLCPMVAVLYVNLDQFGMELKDLKGLFKKEEKAAEIE